MGYTVVDLYPRLDPHWGKHSLAQRLYSKASGSSPYRRHSWSSRQYRLQAGPQLDGTLTLPFKSGGKHHIEGKVHVTETGSGGFGRWVLVLLTYSQVPVQRMLYGTWPLRGHRHHRLRNSLLQETLALRGVCKSSIQALGKKNGWVPDLIGNLLPACNGIQEKAVGLKHIMSADGSTSRNMVTKNSWKLS